MDRERWRFIGRRTPSGWYSEVDEQECYVWRCDNPSESQYIYKIHSHRVDMFWPEEAS